MDVVHIYGPDRIQFLVDLDGCVRAADAIPFHGIVSRGLCTWLRQHSDGPGIWRRNAHRLHDGAPADNDELESLRAAADQLDVLSFGASALAATRYLERLGVAQAQLWNIKEGHTSSVWIATLCTGESFVVNVARDGVAAQELRATSERMQALAAMAPELPLAAVHEICEVENTAPINGSSVVVTRNTLINESLEVHRLPGSGRYAFVERFVADESEPARIRAVRGRLASPREQRAVDRTIERVLAAATADLPITLDVNDGDLVWGRAGAHVVAIG